MSNVMMKALQVQVEVLTRQIEALAPENERVRKLLTEFDKRHSRDSAEIERLRDVAAQAVAVIDAVQKYEQPMDPTEENALTMCEHEIFDFDVNAARAVIAPLAQMEGNR